MWLCQRFYTLLRLHLFQPSTPPPTTSKFGRGVTIATALLPGVEKLRKWRDVVGCKERNVRSLQIPNTHGHTRTKHHHQNLSLQNLTEDTPWHFIYKTGITWVESLSGDRESLWKSKSEKRERERGRVAGECLSFTRRNSNTSGVQRRTYIAILNTCTLRYAYIPTESCVILIIYFFLPWFITVFYCICLFIIHNIILSYYKYVSKNKMAENTYAIHKMSQITLIKGSSGRWESLKRSNTNP